MPHSSLPASLLLACISRAARLTLAPASVYSTRLRTQPASPQKTSPVVMPTATCRLPLEPSSSPSSVQAGMASSAATTSRLESTARSSSWSCWWPGRPKAMRKRVPLSSVMRRVMAPSYRCTAFWMARVACCTTSRLSTSHGFGPSPSTFMKTEMSLRCSCSAAPLCPASRRSSTRAGTKQRRKGSRSGPRAMRESRMPSRSDRLTRESSAEPPPCRAGTRPPRSVIDSRRN
mmetsp:Transcript_29639/g.70358  ORF Transcript_29639/g.70358 Transcript_29639/m.70358 type:complete len:232 (-) Transcript_29639:779-1474(-)